MASLRDALRAKVLGIMGGIVSGGSPEEEDRETFIEDIGTIKINANREYCVWYRGNSSELLNYFTKSNVVEYSEEPYYHKNKRSYFWTESSSEDDIKRTHSGQPANIIQTLTGLIGRPTVRVSAGEGGVFNRMKQAKTENDTVLENILKDSNFWMTYEEIQIPMTLVEGWGCWKVSWDTAMSDHPFASYYRAEYVDFVWKAGRLVGVIFKDWYQGMRQGEKYLVTETRYLRSHRDNDGRLVRDLHIDTEVWAAVGGFAGDINCEVTKTDMSNVPELANVEASFVAEGCDSLLAVPTIFYKDATQPDLPGKSIFQNKCDLFDDLDQELSQKSNAVRKSTPEEVWDTNYLEKDLKTGLTIMPHNYDRKYTKIVSPTDGDGLPPTNNLPVITTQPQINFEQYSQAAIETLSHILSGLMSPATMGIGVAVQSTQQSQREKEKVTIETRNHIISAETDILKNLFSYLMFAEKYLTSPEGVTSEDLTWDISIKYPEFADATFETKAAVLSPLHENADMSDEMYLEKMYGDSLSDEDYQRELQYLKEQKQNQMLPPGSDPQGFGGDDMMGGQGINDGAGNVKMA